MYLLLRRNMVMGIFSKKTYMRTIIEEEIKHDYQKTGCYGNYHFRYIEFNPDEPWFSSVDEYNKEVGQAIFSLSTMHTEYFPNEVETDWSTGKIIKL